MPEEMSVEQAKINIEEGIIKIMSLAWELTDLQVNTPSVNECLLLATTELASILLYGDPIRGQEVLDRVKEKFTPRVVDATIKGIENYLGGNNG